MSSSNRGSVRGHGRGNRSRGGFWQAVPGGHGRHPSGGRGQSSSGGYGHPAHDGGRNRACLRRSICAFILVTPHCSGFVVLACPNKFHTRGLCITCASKIKEGLQGPPGPKAPTHIYDAEIARVSFDGHIYANRLESRRPPAIAPNWSARLCAPNLIGVVVLQGPKLSLRHSDRIFWGEIIASFTIRISR